MSLEECLLAAWDGPFGWLILADPLAPAEIADYAAQVADKQRLAAGMAERDPEKAVQARRLEQRHTELRQALSSGLWQLHVLAGAARPRRRRPRRRPVLRLRGPARPSVHAYPFNFPNGTAPRTPRHAA